MIHDASYVDGFVQAVPTANKMAYAEMSKTFATVMKRHGALAYVECWGDDVPDGEVTSFPMSVHCKDDETVVFSFCLWPDKPTRMKAWEAMESDPEIANMDSASMPFDGKRMIYGGFSPFVNV